MRLSNSFLRAHCAPRTQTRRRRLSEEAIRLMIGYAPGGSRKPARGRWRKALERCSASHWCSTTGRAMRAACDGGNRGGRWRTLHALLLRQRPAHCRAAPQ